VNQQLLGRYRLIERLGEGGMGDVYTAVVDDGDGRGNRVCIKVMKPALASNPRAVDLFLREARHAARLQHPKIVRIHELGREDGTWFLAMELLDGLPWHDIAQRCWRHGTVLPLEVIVGACVDAADALTYAHALGDKDGRPYGIVHRDISPDNLFLTRGGVTRVLDFGIAKAMTPDATHLTEMGELRGKLPYMPPEQVKTDAVDGRADIWALGITLFYLSTAQRPFDRPLPVDTIGAILEEEATTALAMNPALPPAFSALIARCLRKNPADRWPSAAALRAALLELLPRPPDPAEARALLTHAEGLERGDRRPLSALPAAPVWASWSRPPRQPASRPLRGAPPTSNAALLEATIDNALEDIDASAADDDATATVAAPSLASTALAGQRAARIHDEATLAQPAPPRARSAAGPEHATALLAPVDDDAGLFDDPHGDATIAEQVDPSVWTNTRPSGAPDRTVVAPWDGGAAGAATSGAPPDASADSGPTRSSSSSRSSRSSSSSSSPSLRSSSLRSSSRASAPSGEGPAGEVSSPSLSRRAVRPPVPAWAFGLGAFAITVLVASLLVGLALLLRG
jgi:serine/threonine protein kinase